MARDSLIVILAVVALAAGCGDPATKPPALNVILISVDTLRADHLGCYGEDILNLVEIGE